MTGLTPFIIQMIRTPLSALTTASPAALARKYQIPEATAAFQLSAWVQAQGGFRRSER